MIRSNEPPTDDHYRRLSDDERLLLDQLLAFPFPGREEIAAQLLTARVSDTADADTRTIDIVVDASSPRAVTVARVPVEAEADDADGAPIAILLHVVDGLVVELEIYRMDGDAIRHNGALPLRTVMAAEDDSGSASANLE